MNITATPPMIKNAVLKSSFTTFADLHFQVSRLSFFILPKVFRWMFDCCCYGSRRAGSSVFCQTWEKPSSVLWGPDEFCPQRVGQVVVDPAHVEASSVGQQVLRRHHVSLAGPHGETVSVGVTQLKFNKSKRNKKIR